MFKIETHCHTLESSSCGRVPAERVVELYLRAGYDGLIITDHFSQHNSKHLGLREGRLLGYEDQVEKLFEGYEIAKESAQGRIAVLPGLELRFNSNFNDYLVYGMTKEQLLKHPDLFDWGLERFSGYAREKGFMIVQAHPFRNAMTVIDPKLIDLLEVHNGHPRQISRNLFARGWAEMHDLPGSSGSDFHREGDQGHGGVLLPEKPKNVAHFISMMKASPRLII